MRGRRCLAARTATRKVRPLVMLRRRTRNTRRVVWRNSAEWFGTGKKLRTTIYPVRPNYHYPKPIATPANTWYTATNVVEVTSVCKPSGKRRTSRTARTQLLRPRCQGGAHALSEEGYARSRGSVQAATAPPTPPGLFWWERS